LLRIPGTPNNADVGKAVRRHGTPVLDSGNYRHGFTVTERLKIHPGTYAVIVSTFHPGKLGSYSMKVALSTKNGVDIGRVQ